MIRPTIDSAEHAYVIGALLAHLAEHGVEARALPQEDARPGSLSAEVVIDLPQGLGVPHLHLVVQSPIPVPADPPQRKPEPNGAYVTQRLHPEPG